MKKTILFLILIFAATIAAIAQTTGETPPGIDIWQSLGTIGGTVTLIAFVTGWIKTLLKEGGTTAKVISWIVGLLVAFVGWILNLGIFEPMTWWMALITGGLCTLAANGAFTYDTVRMILEFLKAQPKTPPK